MLVATWAGSVNKCYDPKVEEATAVRLALINAKDEQWQKIDIQSYCNAVIVKINEGSMLRRQLCIRTILEDFQQIEEGF